MTRFFGKGIPGVNPESLKGKLLVIEGPDGSGRSAQVELLHDWLEKLGYATTLVGLKRSELVGKDLERLKRGTDANPNTLALFHATELADQLERKIVPALRSGFVVLSHGYVFGLMARAVAGGADPEWIRDVYGFALEPDVVLYLKASPEVLAERHFHKNGMLDYRRAAGEARGNPYESFIHYQRGVQKAFKTMASRFEIINANRSPSAVARQIQGRVEAVLGPAESGPKSG